MTALDEALGEGTTAGLLAAYEFGDYTVENTQNAWALPGTHVQTEWQWKDADGLLVAWLHWDIRMGPPIVLHANTLASEPGHEGEGWLEHVVAAPWPVLKPKGVTGYQYHSPSVPAFDSAAEQQGFAPSTDSNEPGLMVASADDLDNVTG